MSFSYAAVVDTTELSPRLRRITLRVEDPGGLAIQQAGDSAIGVYFPVVAPDGQRVAPAHVTGPDGIRYVDLQSGAQGRNYSVRYQRGDLIDLDIVLHSRGPGTTWARAAAAGDRVGLDHARSWYRPAPDADWQLLVADLSGLPATARIIEQLSGRVPVVAIVEVAQSDDLNYLPTHPDVTVVPSVGTGNGDRPSELAEMVGDVGPLGARGYCWFGGEAGQSRTLRKHLRGMGWGIDQFDVTGYWRFDSESWDAQFALVESDLVAVYTEALAAGKSEEVASEEFDEALERVGL